MAFNRLYANISHANAQLKIFRYVRFDKFVHTNYRENRRHHLGGGFYSNAGICTGISLFKKSHDNRCYQEMGSHFHFLST